MLALNKFPTCSMWRAQHGMSLVELMVGITVGLFVVAAAATLMTNQLSDNRRLLVEMQIQQDLRASMDIITRQIRRAGAVTIGSAEVGLATSTGAGGAISGYTTVTVTPISPTADDVRFVYYRNTAEDGPYGFKLETNIIKTLAAEAGWQELTDANVMKVTAFTVTPVQVASAVLPCPKLCPVAGGGFNTACWPQLVVRDYTVTITAEARNDPTVRRSMSSKVRLRNDWVRFNDAANPNAVCPA